MASKKGKKAATAKSRPVGLFVTLFVVGAIAVALLLVQVQTLGGRAPDFQMEVYGGQESIGGPRVAFHDVLDQGKPVILNFWAGLCPPCRAEMPSFQRLHETHGDDFVMLGVDVGTFTGLGGTQHALDLLEELSITYPTARALSAQPLRDYGAHGMPTTVFLAE
ncbi:MAG: TlpA family protein disulfide reductase, partial [Dehalococcoidia bacterium]